MRKNISLCIAILMAVGCAEEIKPDAAQSSAVLDATKAGEQIEITVTLPQIEALETRVSLSENTAKGFDPSWEAGDKILVGGQTFTLTEANGKTGKFVGPKPEGRKFDIICPATTPELKYVQKADKDYSHIKYSASLLGVDSFEDIHFGYGWAAEHGGTFRQAGCLRLEINLNAGNAKITDVTFSTEGMATAALAIENGAMTDGSFTAYIPCGTIELSKDKTVTIEVTTDTDEVMNNTFYPGPQTLHEGYVVTLVTSDARWTKTLNGKGSENDPYLVSNLEELNNIRNILFVNTTTHFKMTADIDMSSIKDWIPINTLNEAYGIVFDGNGHKLTNFTCTHNERASIFGILHGTVKNLTIEDASVITTSSSPCGIVAAWVGNIDGTLQGRLENVKVVRGKVSNSNAVAIGGMSGRSGEGTFINCSFDGIVERTGTSGSGYVPAGGILGEGLMGMSFTGCSTSGTLTTASGRACGGILGLCNNSVDIKDCSSTMNITARDDVAGGIIGYYGNGTISGCHVASTITVKEKGSGSSYVGGIAGHTSGSVTMTDCTFKGTLDAFSGIVGGILGQCNTSSGNGCTMSRCFSEGTIKATTVVGGLLGRATDYGLNITDCGSTMDIKCTSSYVGGLIGDLPKNATVRNCFATGSVEGSFALGGIAGRAFGRQGSSVSLDVDVKTTVEGCIAFNPSIRTVTSGGESPESHYSGGAVIGCSSRPNTLKNCWRKPDMVFNFYNDASLNVLFDHADSSPAAPLTQPARSAKWFSPYHGKAAAAGTTLSSVAKAAGWSAEVWDLSGDIPKLK